jgi:oligoendopeptidase F/glycerophosphoryl diester phosphodiesterase
MTGGVAWRIIGALALSIGMTQPVAAAAAESYSIDQTRYFATPEAQRLELESLMTEESAFPSAAPQSPKDLLEYLHAAESLLGRLQRHRAYLLLRASRDMDDRDAADAGVHAADAMDRLLGTVGSALRTLGAAALGKDEAALPALKRYAYLLVQAQREVSHQLPVDQQTVLDELADPALANLWTLYEQTVRTTPFAKITTAAGELDVKKHASVLALNPDRSVRQAAWDGRWSGYASRADIYAGILMGVVRLEDRVARLRHFPDAPSMVYFGRNLDRRDVTEALAAIEGHAELLKNYQLLRARHASSVTGIADVRSWDLSQTAPGFTAPRLTLDQTRATALLALAPLGADYVEHFRQLLDPANGRMDVAAEQGKRTNGGFSIGAEGVPSGLFVENYGAGLLNSTRVIVHEGGHAIHRQLMTEGGVSPFYTRGPNWMFEAFATLNEFLLYDHLYRASRDPKAQAYYLEALIDDITFQLFGSAEEGTLEQSIYDGVIGGQIKTAADLDQLSMGVWSKYETWPALEPELAHIWITRSLMVQDPLYLVNYLYAGLLATKMFDMAKREPAAFQVHYAKLLRNGFDAPPDELLRSFFGQDFSQRQLVDDGMRILEQRIQTLAAIYRKTDAKWGISKVKTLDGNPPLIIGHRGLPGLYPEEVMAGYRAAIAAGTDALELDLQSSSDGVLFACHNVFLSDTTDVASHPEFASRRKSRMVDGVSTGPEWYISDFSAAELKTLRVRQPIAVRSKQYDGLYPMATFQEIIDLAKHTVAKDPKRRINVYPETKNALYQRQLGLPLEEKLLAMLVKEGWNTKDSPVFVQSFDPASLKLMRELGLKTKVVQLIDGAGVDYATGAITYESPDSAKPFSWLQAGDARTFAAMVTPAGLAEIKTYADGIGPWKFYILPAQGVDAAGKAASALDQASNTAPSPLIAAAHRAGLFVHPFTFRDEAVYLTKTYGGDPQAEYKAYFDLGVDGMFSDFSGTGRAALTRWLKTNVQ